MSTTLQKPESPTSQPFPGRSVRERFLQATPRQIPQEFWEGFYAQSRKLRIKSCSITAICVLAFSAMGWAGFLPDFFNDLAIRVVFLSPILFGVSIWEAFCLYVIRTPFKLYEQGTAVPVVIDEICLAPASYHNGQANSYSYSAKCSVIESDDWPVDDEVPKQFDVTSAPLTPLEKESCTANLKVGDSDVVLYQPGKLSLIHI